MSQMEVRKALELLKAGNLRMGEEWESAHQISQDREGIPIFDWIHALVHRIEGDDANAAYWYRRAGRTRHPGSIEEEWQSIQATVEKT